MQGELLRKKGEFLFKGGEGFGCGHYSGTTESDRLMNVPVLPSTLYLAVNVLLPAVNPAIRKQADIPLRAPPPYD